MFSKTKIYIDRVSLETIAQDSSISKSYYKNTIEIFRRHAVVYLDITEDELKSIQEPKDLNDPGDIFTFISGKNLPWPTSANGNISALMENNGMPDVNGNTVYILNSKEVVDRLKVQFGVWAIYIKDFNDDVFYYDSSPKLDQEKYPGNTQNGWTNYLKEEVPLLPPSNSMVVSDNNLLKNDKIDKSTGEKHYCGLVNLKDILDMLLPPSLNITYYILVICQSPNNQEFGKLKRKIRKWINEIRLLRNYRIVIEFLITRQTVHSRDLYANNYMMHFDRGFYVFVPWSNIIHKDGASHNKVNLFSYLRSPFKRGNSDLDEAIADLKNIFELYNSFLKNIGDPWIIDLEDDPIQDDDFSKNRILFD